jgi:DNA primase
VNFDQDEAGQKAARKSLDILVAEGLAVHIVELPEGHDPDSYVKECGGEAYRQRLGEAAPYMEWLIRRAVAANDTSTPAGKGAYVQELLPALVAIENAVERAAWVPRVIQAGGLDEAATLSELRRALGNRSGDVARPETHAAPRPRRARLLPAEKWLLTFLLSSTEGAGEALRELTDADLSSLFAAPALRAARSLAGRGMTVSLTSLTAEVADADVARLLSEVAVDSAPTEGVTPEECVRELKRQPLKARMAEIQRDLPTASGPTLEALLQEKLEIGRLMTHM